MCEVREGRSERNQGELSERETKEKSLREREISGKVVGERETGAGEKEGMEGVMEERR